MEDYFTEVRVGFVLDTLLFLVFIVQRRSSYKNKPIIFILIFEFQFQTISNSNMTVRDSA